MIVPQLITERLILRQSKLEDFSAHAAMWSDPRSRAHFSGVPYDEEDTWMRFQRGVGQWHLCGFGIWTLETKADCRYVGAVGFFLSRRALDIPYRDAPEAGWVIAPDFHRQRFASEGMAAAVKWADQYIDAAQTWCMIDPANIPSKRLADSLGYRPAKSVVYKEQMLQTYLRPRLAA